MAAFRRSLGTRGAAALAAALCFTSAACIQDDGRRFNPLRQMIEVSLDDERELGLAFDEELRKHVDVIEDPVIAGFINDLGQSIVSQIEPQPFLYRFRVVRDASLNAFAVPGGYIYFHSGTILAAGSVDELAGVMGHEIAHVHERHYARMREKTQIPDLVVGLAGMAAAVATGEGGLLLASQAANVAAKLKFSREFETEADRYGGVFMTRAGYQPGEIARFFERILDEQRALPDTIPPYLFSHPDVESRIDTVTHQAHTLRSPNRHDPRFDEELLEVQARLAYLIDTGRDSPPPPRAPDDPATLVPLLAQADALAGAGDPEAALATLERIERRAPLDPRATFRRAELLAASGRLEEASAAYRRTLRLDPTRGQTFLQLGLVERLRDRRHSAVQAFEQAARRSGEGSALSQRASWHVETLLFPLLVSAGFHGAASEDAAAAGTTIEVDPTGTPALGWFGQLDDRYDGYAPHLTLTWRDPAGHVRGESPVREERGGRISAELALPDDAARGTWSAALSYQGDPIARYEVTLAEPE